MFDDYISKSLGFWQVPGASIAIVKDGEIVMAKGFGKNVDAETLFPIASLTKSFSSVAAGMFTDLDRPIQEFWPEFKLSVPEATRLLTFRDCLSMRAGLVGHPEDSFWNQSHLTEEMLLETLSHMSFPNGFRGGFVYQNLLHNIVSHVIEKTTGKSWEAFVRENLLNPLNMHATTVSHADFLKVKNRAVPHQWKGDMVTEVPYERLDVITAAAGLASNAHDMAKWLQFILKAQLTADTEVNLENFFAKNELWLDQVFFPNAGSVSYGLGWFIHDYKGLMMCQDPGLIDGFNGLMAVVPELNLGIVVLNNLEAPFFSHSVLFHIVDHYRNEVIDWNSILLDIRRKN